MHEPAGGHQVPEILAVAHHRFFWFFLNPLNGCPVVLAYLDLGNDTSAFLTSKIELGERRDSS